MSNITTDAEAINTSDPLVWVGFACAILSAFGSCAALMIVRLSTEKEAHLPFCQRRLFFIGAWCNLACEAGLTTVALALSPLSLLSPVSGLTIVFGAVFAWVGLFGNKREKATLIELAALSVTVTDELCSSGVDKASEELTNALISAHTKSGNYAQDKMKSMYEELGLAPGQMGLQG